MRIFFWQARLNDMKNKQIVEKSNCASINPAELEKLSTAEAIAYEKLDPTCKKHAEIILGLKEGWESEGCKKQYRDLSRQIIRQI